MLWTLLPLSQVAAFLDVFVFRRKKNREKIITIPYTPSSPSSSPSSSSRKQHNNSNFEKQQVIVISKGYSTTKRFLRRCLQYGIVSGIGMAGLLSFVTVSVHSLSSASKGVGEAIDAIFGDRETSAVANMIYRALAHVPKITDDVANILLYWPFPTSASTSTAEEAVDNFSVINSSVSAPILSTSPKMVFGFSSLAIGALGLAAAFDRDLHFWTASILAFSTFKISTSLAYVAEVLFYNHNKKQTTTQSSSLPSSEQQHQQQQQQQQPLESLSTNTSTPQSTLNTLWQLFSSSNKPSSLMLWIGLAAPIYLLTLLAIYAYFFPSNKHSSYFDTHCNKKKSSSSRKSPRKH